MLNRDKYLNCFSDLYKAATSFCLNPSGQTHLVFLNHGKKTLKSIHDNKAKEFLQRLSHIEKKLNNIMPSNKKAIIRQADEILTLGILLKPQSP